jgi:hypothetical protein
MKERRTLHVEADVITCDICGCRFYDDLQIVEGETRTPYQSEGAMTGVSCVRLPDEHPNAKKDICVSCVSAGQHMHPDWPARCERMLFARLYDVETCPCCEGAGCKHSRNVTSEAACCYHQGGTGRVFGEDGGGLQIGNPEQWDEPGRRDDGHGGYEFFNRCGLILRPDRKAALYLGSYHRLWCPIRMRDILSYEVATTLLDGGQAIAVMEASRETPHPTVFQLGGGGEEPRAEVERLYGSDAARRLGDDDSAYEVTLRVPMEILQ